MGAAVVAATFNVHLGNGVGDRSYVVGGTQDLRSSYKLGVGDMTLDLQRRPLHEARRRTSRPASTSATSASIVPQGVALQVRGDAQLGEVDILGTSDDGRHAKTSVVQAGKHVLVLDTHVGVGQVRVTRAVQ